jgi:hypothetical protein
VVPYTFYPFNLARYRSNLEPALKQALQHEDHQPVLQVVLGVLRNDMCNYGFLSGIELFDGKLFQPHRMKSALDLQSLFLIGLAGCLGREHLEIEEDLEPFFKHTPAISQKLLSRGTPFQQDAWKFKDQYFLGARVGYITLMEMREQLQLLKQPLKKTTGQMERLQEALQRVLRYADQNETAFIVLKND